jgi:hypothetical protein
MKERAFESLERLFAADRMRSEDKQKYWALGKRRQGREIPYPRAGRFFQ